MKLTMQLMVYFYKERGKDALVASIYLSSIAFMFGYLEVAAAEGWQT